MLIIRSLTQRKTSYTGFIFTVRNEVAKVMFLHLSVCPQGGLPQCRDTPRADTPPPEQTPPRAGTPWEQTPWEQKPPKEQAPLSPREQAPPLPEQAPPWSRHPPPRDRHPPAADGYCCGRYASYWNAFFFISLYPPENMPAMNPPCFSNQERHHPKF